MIEQPNRLPLAQYLRLIELAQNLDLKFAGELSVESVQRDIKRELGYSLPASDIRVDFRSYQDLKQEAEAIGQILSTIECEIRPVASWLTPEFVEGLQEEYENKLRAVQDKLELSARLDKEYRLSRDQQGEALRKKREILWEARQQGVGLQSVVDLAQEIKMIEEAEGEISQFHKRSAEAWAELAEQQIDREKAIEYWEKALEQDNWLDLRDRRDRHLVVLGTLEDEAARSYDDLLKEAREVYDRATQAPLESLSRPENDLRLAWEKCEYIVKALTNYPYPSSTCQKAAKLMVQISDYNDHIWQARAIACITQAEVDLVGDNLDQANESLAHAQQALALIWDEELQSSHSEKLEAIQRKIEIKARQRTDGVVDRWRQRAQAYLDNKDAVAALNCIYVVKTLTDDGAPEGGATVGLETLEDQALAIFSQEVKVEPTSVAEQAKQLFSQGDRESAFRWLQAALQLDATAILSEPGFVKLTDAYFEFQSKRQRVDSLLVQAEFRLAQDPGDRENMLAAEGFLAEANKLLAELGETSRLPEIDENKKTLQKRHRKALIEELNSLLQKLDNALRDQEPASQQTTEILLVLKDIAYVLAKIEKAKFMVKNLKPHLQRAFDYYAQLQSYTEFEGDLNTAEGYTLSYMLLSKVSTWETR